MNRLLATARQILPRFNTIESNISSAKAVVTSQQQNKSMPTIENPLVWVDCEMTGLGDNGGPGEDTILEIAVVITDGLCDKVIQGPELVIHHKKETLATMNDWCKNQFGWNNGDCEPGNLADKVLKSQVSMEEADAQVCKFLNEHIPGQRAPLAGNSVHMDKRFLDKWFPKFTELLHYRIVDVSTVKELCARWYPKQYQKAPKKKLSHRALDDILESIAELQFYRGAVFKPTKFDAYISR